MLLPVMNLHYCFANFSVTYANFLQSLKLGMKSYLNAPKDRLTRIVSRLHNEMNKPFRYTIIHCTIKVTSY